MRQSYNRWPIIKWRGRLIPRYERVVWNKQTMVRRGWTQEIWSARNNQTNVDNSYLAGDLKPHYPVPMVRPNNHAGSDHFYWTMSARPLKDLTVAWYCWQASLSAVYRHWTFPDGPYHN